MKKTQNVKDKKNKLEQILYKVQFDQPPEIKAAQIIENSITEGFKELTKTIYSLKE